ncbi:MAG TPA: hypothetical protein VKX40_10985 [Aequorivita sp.]|nr:hypothetical protein [Aequorivita sp.]
MFRKLLILAVVLTVSACGNNKITLGKTEVVNYHSLGNGVADISLKLYDNETFLFKLKGLSQPEIDEKPIEISEIGTYTSQGTWKILHFNNQKFNLGAIFDEQFLTYNEFEVIDRTKVKIDTTKEVIPIWGVLCERK